MPVYDGRRFDPPAPVATVDLRDPRTGSELTQVEMLIDSGADITVVPQGAVGQLGVKPVEGALVEVVGFDGTRSAASSVVLEMRFLGRTFSGRFLIAPLEIGVLGRNVLDALSLSLDGPRLTWAVAPSTGQAPP